jgi:GTP-binding protein
MFVDRVQIELQAGKGGDGCMSFRREKFVPKGGPDGGDGGDGGSIIIEAREGVDHLSALAHRKLWRATKGKNGSGANKTGRKGEDLTILVPPGTIVMDAEELFVIREEPGASAVHVWQRRRATAAHPGIKSHCRRRPDRKTERRQEHSPQSLVACQAGDRQLSVHNKASESRPSANRL